MTPTNPRHGYLTEPAWFTSRAVVRELTCLETWAQLLSLGSVIFVLWIVLS